MTMIRMTDDLFVFRNCILEDLVDRGYKYIARDKEGAIYAFSRQPIKLGWAWSFDMASNDDKMEDISIVSGLFYNVKWEDEKPFKIPYTNWEEVHVNTPVVYTGDNGKSFVRHFCKYDEDNNRVFIYTDGRTSFTGRGTMEARPERVSIYEQGEKLKNGNISNNND